MSVWVIVDVANDYDQPENNLVVVFGPNKPSAYEVEKVLKEYYCGCYDDFLPHIARKLKVRVSEVASELLGLRTVGNRYPPRHSIDNYIIKLKQVEFGEVLSTEGR